MEIMLSIPKIIDPDGLASGVYKGVAVGQSCRLCQHFRLDWCAQANLMLSKADMIVSAKATCRHFGIVASSVLHLPLSTDYIAGKMMVVRAFVSGATLIVERPSKPTFGFFTYGNKACRSYGCRAVAGRRIAFWEVCRATA